MNHNSIHLTKEEIFRLYEQSELSDIINEEKPIYKKMQKLKVVKNRIPFLYTFVSAGVLAGAVSLITLLRK